MVGWALVLLGMLLIVWRLRVDYLSAHVLIRLRVPTAIATPHHSPSATPAGRAAHGTPTIAFNPRAALAIAGGPSLDAHLVNGIFAAYGSPLYGHGREIVALSTHYRVDDAVALAFFVMESRAGTQGEAVLTHSFGNLRPMPNQPTLDGYRAYSTWIEGAAEWFRVMRTLYLDGLHLQHVEDAVPVYAPPSDTNDPTTIVLGIHQLVACWHGSLAVCPADPPAVRALIAATNVQSR